MMLSTNRYGVQNLIDAYKQINQHIIKNEVDQTLKAIEYYRGEKNVSTHRMIIDVLKSVKDKDVYSQLFTDVLAELEHQIGEIN